MLHYIIMSRYIYKFPTKICHFHIISSPFRNPLNIENSSYTSMDHFSVDSFHVALKFSFLIRDIFLV
jgi:hypothetical protein